MGALKRDLKKDMQAQGTDKWGSRLDKVVKGVNNQSRQALLGEDANTAHYKPGQEQPEDKALEFELREHAGRQMTAQDAQVRLAQTNVQATGKFREYIGRGDHRKRGTGLTSQGTSLLWKVCEETRPLTTRARSTP